MPSYIPLQPRFQHWATINSPPSKHSPAIFQPNCKSPKISCSQGTAPLTCSCFPTILSCPFSEGAQAYPNFISTEGDHCTHITYTRKSPTQICVHRPSPSGRRPQHQDLPSFNPTMTTQFCNRAITCGLVPVRLPTTVGKPELKGVMSPHLSTFSNNKNKPTSSSTQPAVRRSNIGTSSVAPTATPGSRPSPTI